MGLFELLRHKSYKNFILLLVFPIVYFLAIGFGLLRWQRWMIPVLPFEAIFFGVGVYALFRLCTRNRTLLSHRNKLAVLLAFAVIAAAAPSPDGCG